MIARPWVAACALIGSAMASAAALASTPPDFAWSENAGWINVSPAAPGGVCDPIVRVLAPISTDFAGGPVTGALWGENIGWINLQPRAEQGLSAPALGVQADALGTLTGFAWGENVGWVNFGPFASVPSFASGAHLTPSGAFAGFAWSENLGWINLAPMGASSGEPAEPACVADLSGDGQLNNTDINRFVTLFLSGCAAADLDANGALNNNDINRFVQAFLAGC